MRGFAQSLATLQHISCRLVGGALDPLIQVVDKDIKQNLLMILNSFLILLTGLKGKIRAGSNSPSELSVEAVPLEGRGSSSAMRCWGQWGLQDQAPSTEHTPLGLCPGFAALSKSSFLTLPGLFKAVPEEEGHVQ